MQSLRRYWQWIDWPKAALLGVFLIIAWLLSDRLDQSTKDTILIVSVFGGIPIQMFARMKSRRWLRLGHPVDYVLTFAWLATTAVWFVPEMRRDYLPPSSAIDAAFIFAGILAAIFLLPKKLSPASLEAE